MQPREVHGPGVNRGHGQGEVGGCADPLEVDIQAGLNDALCAFDKGVGGVGFQGDAVRWTQVEPGVLGGVALVNEVPGGLHAVFVKGNPIGLLGADVADVVGGFGFVGEVGNGSCRDASGAEDVGKRMTGLYRAGIYLQALPDHTKSLHRDMWGASGLTNTEPSPEPPQATRPQHRMMRGNQRCINRDRTLLFRPIPFPIRSIRPHSTIPGRRCASGTVEAGISANSFRRWRRCLRGCAGGSARHFCSD